jgi:putative nucleotidyltransferase with HDIG domain
MDLNRIREEILANPDLGLLSRLAKERNFSLYLVGGTLRDLLLGLKRKDYDLAIPREQAAAISAIEEAFSFRFFKVGKEEGKSTFRIIRDGFSLDCTYLQGESIDADLARRDFTINAIAYGFREERFYWVREALEDLEKRVIRTVSARSIDQDLLRMLRAVRYATVLEQFRIEEDLKSEIRSKAERITEVAAERIKMELDQILLSPRPAQGVDLLYETGLLFRLFPELRGLENLDQNAHHHLSVLPHVFLVLEKVEWACDWVRSNFGELALSDGDRLALAYAALFHDIGKQDTYSRDEEGKVHFIHHESFSARAAERIMERLRFSNMLKFRVLRLVENHMRILNLSAETKENALRRLVHRMGDEAPLLVLLSLADKEASRGILSYQTDSVVEGHCLRVLQLHGQKEIVQPPRLISGHDVMALGYPPGPKVGQILSFVREKQIAGEIRTREEALEEIRNEFGRFHLPNL